MKTKKFEEKMQELESIVNELEKGEIDLDTSIAKYTEAMKLVKECVICVIQNKEIKEFVI